MRVINTNNMFFFKNYKMNVYYTIYTDTCNFVRGALFILVLKGEYFSSYLILWL